MLRGVAEPARAVLVRFTPHVPARPYQSSREGLFASSNDRSSGPPRPPEQVRRRELCAKFQPESSSGPPGPESFPPQLAARERGCGGRSPRKKGGRRTRTGERKIPEEVLPRCCRTRTRPASSASPQRSGRTLINRLVKVASRPSASVGRSLGGGRGRARERGRDRPLPVTRGFLGRPLLRRHGSGDDSPGQRSNSVEDQGRWGLRRCRGGFFVAEDLSSSPSAGVEAP